MANLKIGSTGPEAEKLQIALKNAGYDVGAIDGVVGKKTDAALRQYQKDNGLNPDGVAGPLTNSKLYSTPQTTNALGTLANGSLLSAQTAAGNNNAKSVTAGNQGLKSMTQGTVASAQAAGGAINDVKPTSVKDKETAVNLDDVDGPSSYPTEDTPSEPTASEVPAFSYPGYTDPDIVKEAERVLAEMSAPTYSSQWQAQIQEYLNKIMNRDPFSYNFNEDALYQQYKDIYTQMGLMAMMDTMGQASAMTGGYGNSYAQTVGQQAYNQQLSQLNNVLPELYQMAYDRYAYEGDQLYQQYGLLMDQENMDYNRYLDSYNQYLANRDYWTGVRDSEREFAYNKYTDEYDNVWNEYVTGLGMQENAAGLMAGVGDYGRAGSLYGLTAEEISKLEDGYNESKTTQTGNNEVKYADFTYAEQQKWKKEFEDAQTPEDLEKVKKRMEQAGIDPEIAEDWYNDYANGFKPGVEDNVFTDAAKAFMSNLPYAHAGSDMEVWKNVVKEKMMAQYESGALTDEDVIAIINKLGL